MQGACVQNVLDSLIPALLADKNRKFIYVEQARVKTYHLCSIALHIKAVFGVQTDTNTSRYIQIFRVDVSVLCLNVRVYLSALLICMQS